MSRFTKALPIFTQKLRSPRSMTVKTSIRSPLLWSTAPSSVHVGQISAGEGLELDAELGAHVLTIVVRQASLGEEEIM